MRNILITVMMLIVVAILFTTIVKGNGGLQENIKTHGTNANNKILNLTP
jgi:hypothetical protein